MQTSETCSFLCFFFRECILHIDCETSELLRYFSFFPREDNDEEYAEANSDVH
jgi:hypothetical protein